MSQDVREFTDGVTLPPVMQKPGRPIPDMTAKFGKVADKALEMLEQLQQGVLWKTVTKKQE